MADKAISDLVRATQINDNDLFVVEQGGVAKKFLGVDFKQYIAQIDINSIESVTFDAQGRCHVILTDGTETISQPLKGRDGTDGTDGADGEDAPVITDISIDTNYHLIITLSNGTSYDAGYCRGASGAGTGDMQEADYDPNGSVKGAGGIVAYLVGTVQPRITENGILKGDGNGGVSTAEKNVDYLGVPTGGTTGQVLKKTATGTQWANESGAVTSVNGRTGAVSVNEVSSGGTTGQVLTKGASGYGWQAPSGGMTEAQVNAKLGRTTAVDASDTNYTTYMARGIALFNDSTNPTVNGTIAMRYY